MLIVCCDGMHLMLCLVKGYEKRQYFVVYSMFRFSASKEQKVGLAWFLSLLQLLQGVSAVCDLYHGLRGSRGAGRAKF